MIESASSSRIADSIESSFVENSTVIERFDPTTGASLGTFTTGHALHEIETIAFGPDHQLYVGDFDSCVTGPNGCTGQRGEILKFDHHTGAFIETFVADGSGGLDLPYSIAFGSDGNFYVANYSLVSNTGTILRFHGPKSSTPGAPHPSAGLSGASFTSHTSNPLQIAFGPDDKLYASDAQGDVVVSYDSDGSFLGTFVSVTGGPRGLAFRRSKH
jgi:WD40 repeat protein